MCKTFFFKNCKPSQKPLPKLPVPDLHSTFVKYLRCITPIVSEENYKITEALVKDFIKPGGLGEKLQNILKKINEEKDNWVFFLDLNRVRIFCLIWDHPILVIRMVVGRHVFKKQVSFADKFESRNDISKAKFQGRRC
jgi:hypothetical protein